MTESAWRSLDQAIYVLSVRWDDRVVDRIVTEIWEHIDIVLQYPLGGQLEEDLAELGRQHRRMVCGHFKIIYFVEGEDLYVTDIFDSRQDPGKMKG
ncbi:MAG: type II toxin-antitoxin system RelE/ParE family toxin [Flavobacteriales bacterium]|jgi:plasmid stabilization system protein ParE|nr:type II toxin-antitoxin system RelE/ParE family toxin [Flavobacteriales bacterium]